MPALIEQTQLQEVEKASKAMDKKNCPHVIDPVSVYSKASLDNMLMRKLADGDQKNMICSNSDYSGMSFSSEGDEADDMNGILPERVRTPSAISHFSSVARSLDVLGFLGIKADLSSRIEGFKDMYRKNYGLSKSHNFMIGKFAAMKLGFCNMMLSMLGVKPEEMSELALECRRDLVAQNKRLFEENEYTSELLEIVGGAKKKIKAERTIVAEIRKQLMAQMSNLGEKDYYAPIKILEVQKEQCLLIKSKMSEERGLLEYQRNMLSIGMISDDIAEQLEQKLAKAHRILARAESRAEMYSKKMAQKKNSLKETKGLV